MIEILLSTDLNYTNYLLKHHLTVVSIVYFCDVPGEKVINLGDLGVYRKKGQYIPVDQFENAQDQNIKPYTYHTFIDTFNKDMKSSIPGSFSTVIIDFDLRLEPHDICLYFHGAATLYAEDSNVVRIPKEELIKLFATAPRTLGN